MTDSEQKNAAKQFVKDWTGKGFEAQLLQPAMEDLKFGRTIDGNTALEAVMGKYGLKPNPQFR